MVEVNRNMVCSLRSVVFSLKIIIIRFETVLHPIKIMVIGNMTSIKVSPFLKLVSLSHISEAFEEQSN